MLPKLICNSNFSISEMKLTIVETHNISPVFAPNTTTNIPFTYFDVFWIPFPKTEVVFFYSIPSITTQHFLTSFLPILKTSLSTSLKIFFPLTGTFTPPIDLSSQPFIHCTEHSYVPLVIAEEATQARSYFNHLVGKEKMGPNVTEFHPLVPDLVNDVLALQMTIFPDCGICFGITFKHVVADGKSISAFLHNWASICVNNGIMPDNTIMPKLDKSLIPDPNGTVLDTVLKQMFALKTTFVSTGSTQVEKIDSEVKIRGTFVVTKSEIENMRVWILKQVGNEDLHLSTYVLSCSLIWVSMIKSKKVQRKSDVCPTDLCYFGQSVDCRDRYELKSIVPLTYFGNCLDNGCIAEAKMTDIESEDGFVIAVRTIGNRIKRLELDGALANVEDWIPSFSEICKIGNNVSVAGSPRLDFYGVDFGWGRPVKVEFVTIGGNAISIAEHVGEEGGVEFGLALEIAQMEAFASILDECKCKYCGPC